MLYLLYIDGLLVKLSNAGVGCELWRLNDININQFCTAWRTGLRRAWKIPNTSHSDLVHMTSDELPIFKPNVVFVVY